jgi:hypothetical protein
MPTSLSTHLVIGQVIAHTPVWVWGLLVFIAAMGLRQMADHVVTVRRLVIVPLIWCTLSLWSATSAFGVGPGVLLAWALGASLAVAGNQWLLWPRGVQALGDGRYAIPGSIWPLITMGSVFIVRYVTAVTLVLHPALRHDAVFSLAIPLAYGLLSGIFLARAVRILRNTLPRSTLALA